MGAGVVTRAQKVSAFNAAAGVADLINGLGPGVSVEFTFSGPGEGVALGGHNVTVTVSGQAFSSPCLWSLPNAWLSAGRPYILSLDGRTVEVKAAE